MCLTTVAHSSFIASRQAKQIDIHVNEINTKTPEAGVGDGP